MHKLVIKYDGEIDKQSDTRYVEGELTLSPASLVEAFIDQSSFVARTVPNTCIYIYVCELTSIWILFKNLSIYIIVETEGRLEEMAWEGKAHM